MLNRITTITVLGMLIGLMPAGCGKKPEEKRLERAIEKQTGGKAKVNLAKDSIDMKIKTAEGEMTIASGGGAKIPKDFPKDVYVYKGASVTMSMTLPDGHSVTLQTKDSVEKAVEAYKKQMEAQGWKQQAAVDMGETAMLSYEKGERAVAISFSQADEGTQITITAQKQR